MHHHAARIGKCGAHSAYATTSLETWLLVSSLGSCERTHNAAEAGDRVGNHHLPALGDHATTPCNTRLPPHLRASVAISLCRHHCSRTCSVRPILPANGRSSHHHAQPFKGAQSRPCRRPVACHMRNVSSQNSRGVASTGADGTHAKLRRGIRISTRCDMMAKMGCMEPLIPMNRTRGRFLHQLCHSEACLQRVRAALQKMYAAIIEFVRA